MEKKENPEKTQWINPAFQNKKKGEVLPKYKIFGKK